MSSADEWDDFVEALARKLVSALRRRLYDFHLGRIRLLGAPSEKLVYLFLMLAEPQSFTSIRRSLGLAVKTVDRALRRLRASECVMLDDVYQYWIVRSTGKVKCERIATIGFLLICLFFLNVFLWVL